MMFTWSREGLTHMECDLNLKRLRLFARKILEQEAERISVHN